MRPSSTMRVESVNVGLPREVLWKGRTVRTSMYKEPMAGRVALRRLNLDGDEQSDLKAHGGPDMAIYLYPAEYYAFWREQYPEMELPWGMFGENLTIWGLLDESVYIGDQLRVGSALLAVTQPRVPCYKLALKFGRDDILKRLYRSGYSGFYCRVLEEGAVAAGDPISVPHRDERAVTVHEILSLEGTSYFDVDLLRRAAAVEALGQGWRESLLRRLEPFSDVIS
ncbi:MAG TPA: MOSC domain-containing protein [Ktedonobacterales bacterium]|nr:MOSC domain-containing protein [Ktedonobacterales bacterium]